MKVSIVRAAVGLLILFLLYQSAEGVGQRILDSFSVQAGLMLLCLVAGWPVGRFILRYRGFDAYALEWRPLVPMLLIGGIVLALIAKLLALAAGAGLGVYSVDMQAPTSGAGSLMPILAIAMISTFVPSLAEDIITRGFWWRVPGDTLRGAKFVLVTSAIYVANHIFRLGNGPAEWLMLFCFGVAYAVAVTKTGSLWAAVGVHWGWNLTNALVPSFATVEATSAGAPFISAAAHLLMASVMLLLPNMRGERADAK